MLNLLLSFLTDAKHFLFWRWPGSGKAQNWILFQSIFDSLYGSLFVVTRSSCTPSTLLGLCFCLFRDSAKDNCLRCHSQNLLQLPVTMSESQNCNCADESLAVFLLSAEKVRNSLASLPRESLATISLAPVILSAKCVVAFATCTGNHPAYSSVKWEVLPFFCRIVSWMQSAGRSQVQVARVYGKSSFESRSQAEPLVWHCGRRCFQYCQFTFPLAVLTTSEVCSGSLEEDMSENHPAYSSVKWEVLPFLVCKSSLDAICRARPRAGCKYIWEMLVWQQITSCTFTSKYWVKHSWITLAYDSYPSIIGLSQDMWHSGRRCL